MNITLSTQNNPYIQQPAPKQKKQSFLAGKVVEAVHNHPIACAIGCAAVAGVAFWGLSSLIMQNPSHSNLGSSEDGPNSSLSKDEDASLNSRVDFDEQKADVSPTKSQASYLESGESSSSQEGDLQSPSRLAPQCDISYDHDNECHSFLKVIGWCKGFDYEKCNLFESYMIFFNSTNNSSVRFSVLDPFVQKSLGCLNCDAADTQKVVEKYVDDLIRDKDWKYLHHYSVGLTNKCLESQSPICESVIPKFFQALAKIQGESRPAFSTRKWIERRCAESNAPGCREIHNVT